MTARTRRRLIRTAIAVVVLLVSGWCFTAWLESQVKSRSEAIVAQAAGPGSRIRIEKVDLDLWNGDVEWTGLHIEQTSSNEGLPAHGSRFSGTVEKSGVYGLSYWQLLFGSKLSMRSLLITHPDIEMMTKNDTTGTMTGTPRSNGISAFMSDSVVVVGGIIRVGFEAEDTTLVSVDTLDASVLGLKATWAGGHLETRIAGASAHFSGVRALLPPLYELSVAVIDIDGKDRNVRVTDATLKSAHDPDDYDQIVPFESDLFLGHMDTLLLGGLDLAALVSSANLRAITVRIAGVDLNVHRDKTMPDAPYKVKPLPTHIARNLPIPVCFDSLVMDRWNVHYQEKDVHSPEYGQVDFAGFHGTVTGLCTLDTTSRDTMTLMATAIGFDQARIALRVRTVINDPSDRFTANGTISGLSFSAFNTMTSDLILARATAGTIGGIDLTMNADHDHATGRVDMEYDKLELELLKQDGSGERRKFMSGLLNQMVHTRNLRSDPAFRHGDFDFERRKDRSFFNYLWTGLREGLIVTTLPGVLESVRQIDQASKTEKRKEGK